MSGEQLAALELEHRLSVVEKAIITKDAEISRLKKALALAKEQRNESQLRFERRYWGSNQEDALKEHKKSVKKYDQEINQILNNKP